MQTTNRGALFCPCLCPGPSSLSKEQLGRPSGPVPDCVYMGTAAPHAELIATANPALTQPRWQGLRPGRQSGPRRPQSCPRTRPGYPGSPGPHCTAQSPTNTRLSLPWLLCHLLPAHHLALGTDSRTPQGVSSVCVIPPSPILIHE